MTWLHRLNPTPAFPSYTGPYKVGTVDVEIAASELQSPGPSVSPCTNVPTVAFRIFYPCRPDSAQKYGKWIPSPQREYIGAYARFLGANNIFSQLFALMPQLLYYVSIPAHHNAEMLEPPTRGGRWPVMVFSHGLGGSRNAYSHIIGSLASHGIVVVAPDHRDGSSPISFVHTPAEKEKARKVEYRKVAHQASTEVYEARDEQLRIRLWELGLIHDALLKLDERIALSNAAEDQKNGPRLTMFADKLKLHEPGSIAFAGHSFGAATVVQFVKSVFYHSEARQASDDYTPLFTPSSSASIVDQITPATPVFLLDLWTLPIQSPATTWLRRRPMPCYDSPHGGSNLLAILSEAFYRWSSNLNETAQVVAKPRAARAGLEQQPGPHIFYPVASAHLSQSDFGVLFPWLTAKVFGAREPERVLKLNVRAILQVLREGGAEIAETRGEDLEVGKGEEGAGDDRWILSRVKGEVRDWVAVNTEPGVDGVAGVSKGSANADKVVEGEVLGQVVRER